MADDELASPSMMSDYIKRYDPMRTYELICEKKGAEVGREAVTEAWAAELTSKFRDEQAEIARQQRERELGLHNALHAKISQQHQEQQAGARLFDRMVKEEKEQVNFMILEQRQRKEQEIREAQADREARAHLSQAHSMFIRSRQDKLDSRRRDQAEQFRTTILSKQEKAAQYKEQVAAEAALRRKEEIEKREARFKEAVTRREKQLQQEEEKRREEAAAFVDKQSKALRLAEEHKKELVQQKVVANEQRLQGAQRLVQSARGDEKRRRQSVATRLVQTLIRAGEAKDMEMAATRQRQNELHADNAKKLGQVRDRRKAGQEELAQQVIRKMEDNVVSVQSCFSMESQVQNVRADRAYFKVRQEIDQKRNQMYLNKDYQTVAKSQGAQLDVDSSNLDTLPRQAHRLKVLRQSYVEKSRDDGSQLKSARTRTMSTGEKRCGLCNQEFPVDRLTGTAPRVAVQRHKRMWRVSEGAHATPEETRKERQSGGNVLLCSPCSEYFSTNATQPT
mmetsp:Transcript_28308/g.73206  ORF Transcript_28308/g.73206 Transcript_28308/m.73206 type:complete len:507 (+) Transcript_28308:86-1606(+)